MPNSLVRRIHVLDDHSSSNVLAVRFYPDASAIKSYDMATGIQTHRVKDGSKTSLMTYPERLSVVISPDARTVVFAQGSGLAGKLIGISDSGDQTTVASTITPFRFYRDDSVVGVGRDELSNPNQLTLQQFSTGEVISAYPRLNFGLGLAVNSDEGVAAISHFLPLEAVGDETEIEIVRLSNGNTEKRIPIHRSGATHLTFSPNSMFLLGVTHESATSDSWNQLNQWSLLDGSLVSSGRAGANGGDEVYCIAAASNSNLIAVGSMENLELWQSNPLRRLTSVSAHEDVIICVDFSLDGKLLASGSGDGTICIWSVDSLLKPSVSRFER